MIAALLRGNVNVANAWHEWFGKIIVSHDDLTWLRRVTHQHDESHTSFQVSSIVR